MSSTITPLPTRALGTTGMNITRAIEKTGAGEGPSRP
jgi:hypothetical protein